MFEILIGRTPFEEEGDNTGINTEAEYLEYWKKSCRAEWLGYWSMPHGKFASSHPMCLLIWQTCSSCYER